MAVVARTYRGALRDLEHHGRIVVADAAGNVLCHYGDPYAITFARSAAKPMQAIAVCESGALEAYGVTEQELAVMCASHNGEPAQVALVGYTNAGKSSLLNALSGADVYAEDKLFATLDPTARALELPDGRKVMLIDTVGLVRRLPHQLVEAFHSTLEEAASADLILSVCDITSPELLEQRAVTERLLEELGVEGTPVITVLNKCDAAPDAQNEPYKGCVRISAKTGYGLPRLLQTIAETLPPQRIRCRLCLPYAEGALLHRLEEQGQIFSREYTAEGTLLDAEVEQRDWRLYETYLRTED